LKEKIQSGDELPHSKTEGRGLHVCLFDIDGTLIASGGAGKAALELALAAEFGISEIGDALDLRGRTDRGIAADLLAGLGIAITVETVRRLLDAYLRHLPECLKRTQGRILPGIAELLKQLQERSDIALGLLTGNIRDGARLKLSHYGLWDYFSFGGYGDEHLDRDDVAREALREVHTRFNGEVHPERIWVLGDTPLDIRCARAIGAKVIAVGTGWHSLEELAEHQPDLLLADLSDPAALLAHWDSPR
jgi:phosphoglycolate phosphatase-like HAD superfamily hydrolase